MQTALRHKRPKEAEVRQIKMTWRRARVAAVGNTGHRRGTQAGSEWRIEEVVIEGNHREAVQNKQMLHGVGVQMSHNACLHPGVRLREASDRMEECRTAH